MSARLIIFVAIGFGLLAVSHAVELQGDAAPFAKDGVSTDRLQYHLAALVLLLGALGCFITAGIQFLRKKRG